MNEDRINFINSINETLGYLKINLEVLFGNNTDEQLKAIPEYVEGKAAEAALKSLLAELQK